MSTSVDGDLPPSTWRSWWKGLPEWFRIGCWAVFASIAIQFAIVIRILIGLMEPGEITALRRSGVEFQYSSDRYSNFGKILALAEIGFRGLSCNDVVAIQFHRNGADQLLSQIGPRFAKLDEVNLAGSDVTGMGLKSLTNCRSLHGVDLGRTEVSDASLGWIEGLPSLHGLELDKTLITDAVMPLLQRVSSLQRVNVAMTDVSLTAIHASRAQRGNLTIVTEKDCAAESVLGKIRWADGKLTRRFPGDFQIVIASVGESSNQRLIEKSSNLGFSQPLWWSVPYFENLGEGEFEIRLRLGQYDAQPVRFQFVDQSFSVKSVEFRMPVTMDEALNSQPAHPDLF